VTLVLTRSRGRSIGWALLGNGILLPEEARECGGRIVSTADGGTYAYVMFAQIPAARRSVGARSKLGSVTVKAIGLDGVSATTTFPVIAIVEKDPPPPPKNVGKLVPKSLLAWRESRATTRGRVTIIDRDQAGAPT